MNWPEAAVAIFQIISAPVAAVAGAYAVYSFGQRKDHEQQRIEKLRLEHLEISSELEAQRQVYLDFRAALAGLSAAMAGPARREEQYAEVRAAYAKLQLAYAALELQSSPQVSDAAKAAYVELTQWVDEILEGRVDIGIPSYQANPELTKLAEVMRLHISGYIDKILNIKSKF